MAIASSTLALLALTSAGVSAVGQAQEGRQRAESEQFNAKISRQQADIVKVRGKLDVTRQRKRAKSFTSEQQALYSKAGVVLSGSPLKVIEESAANAELDILLTEFNTASQAQRLISEAQQSDIKAKAEKAMGYARAGKTLLIAGAQTALMFGANSGSGKMIKGGVGGRTQMSNVPGRGMMKTWSPYR